MTEREQIRQLLNDAVADNRLQLDHAQELLAAYDAGEITAERIHELVDKRDNRALLLLLAIWAAERERRVRYEWNRRQARYIAPDGTPEPPSRIRVALDTWIDEQRANPVTSTAEPVSEGEALPPLPPHVPTPAPSPQPLRPPIDIDARITRWRENFERIIAERHMAAAGAGRGGFAHMTQADRDWVRERILQQYQYLDGFETYVRQAWHSGNPPSLEYMAGRMQMYLEAVRGTYEEMLRRAHAAAGFTRERSLLGVAEHCDLCVSEAARGWVPIGTLVPIGQRTCLSQCKCRLEFMREGAQTRGRLLTRPRGSVVELATHQRGVRGMRDELDVSRRFTRPGAKRRRVARVA